MIGLLSSSASSAVVFSASGDWSASASSLLEAAGRSLLLGTAVAVGLRVLRIRNVVAQKSAWVLVLFSAFLMPVLAPWASGLSGLPRATMLVLPVDGWIRGLQQELMSATRKPSEVQSGPALGSEQRWVALPAEHAVAAAESEGVPSGAPLTIEPARRAMTSVSHQGATNKTATAFETALSADPRSASPGATSFAGGKPPARFAFKTVAAMAYLLVSGVLLFRLAWGLMAALGLWRSGEPVKLGHATREGMRVRWSFRIMSPVTVGSGIVLPADYAEWDTEKLRIVLAHEQSHVNQGDFYLQALAGLYTALFWFSPLGWWLKRKLSDLGEAISDRAGLDQAGSNTSYARILLQFAAVPHRAQIGVAMARNGNLSQRIDRLLNEARFRQAFAGGKGRMLAALLLVPAALFGATALVRVEARTQAPPAPAAAASGQAHPESAPDQTEVVQSSPGQSAPDSAARVPPAKPVPPAEAPVPSKVPAVPPASPEPVEATEPALAPVPPLPGTPPPPMAGAGSYNVNLAQDTSVSLSNSGSSSTVQLSQGSARDSKGNGYRYSYASNGDSYALITGKDHDKVHFSGELHNGPGSDIDKARRMAKGDFLWFMRDGKSYVVDAPSVVSQIQEMYRPMDELGRRQEELGKQQEELGRQQEELGRRQEQATIPAPDLSKEMAILNEEMAKLQALKGGTVTQNQLADLQGKLGDLQGKLGELQGRMGGRMGELGAEQGRLGSRQGELGARQGQLGAEQGRLAREADRRMKSIIDESLRNGKARPVQ